MIKIIKNGVKPKKMKTIWTFKCPVCGCEFECELDDFKTLEKKLEGDKSVNCPCCNTELHTNRNKYTIREEEDKVVDFPIGTGVPKDFYPHIPYPNIHTGDPYLGEGGSITTNDPCITCPHRDGPKDVFGNPIAGDSMCQWCPHYKWKVTWNSCSDSDTYSVDSINIENK